MIHEKIQEAVSKVQQAYNEHRALELDGTPKLSTDFFDNLKTDGPIAAFDNLVEKQKTVGNPNVPPQVKAAMNLGGSLLLASGIREMAGIDKGGRLVNPYRSNLGHVPLKQRVAEIIFNFTLGILFTAQDGGQYDAEYGTQALANEHRKAGHQQIDYSLEENLITPEEAEQKHKDYDRKHGWG